MDAAHRLFFSRVPIDVDVGDAPAGLIGYPNVPGAIGSVISSGNATLVELQTVLGTEDVYDLLEIISVDAHNRRVLNPPQEP